MSKQIEMRKDFQLVSTFRVRVSEVSRTETRELTSVHSVVSLPAAVRLTSVHSVVSLSAAVS